MSDAIDPGRAEQRDRRALVALLASASVLCWTWTLRMAADLEGHGRAHGAEPVPLFVMWAVMMAGMMIPPELPAMLRLARALRQGLGRSPLPGAGAFLAGYLLPWTAFSLAAALLQARLQDSGLMGHDMATSSRALAGTLLLAAGAAQLTPLKRACLERCRAGFAAAESSGAAAFAAGLRRSAVSIASCGLLMLVLFVTGVMSLAWMVLITALLVVENTVPPQWQVSAATGALLLGWGGATLVG